MCIYIIKDIYIVIVIYIYTYIYIYIYNDIYIYTYKDVVPFRDGRYHLQIVSRTSPLVSKLH